MRLRRTYTNNGQGISSKIQNNYDKRKYVISTAKHPMGFWQLAVFRSILGIANPFKPLRVQNAQTFEEAEKKHFEIENLVANFPIAQWRNW
jgi:hypothetical protein